MKKAQPPYSYGGVEAKYPGYNLFTFEILKSIIISYSLVELGIGLVKGGTYPPLWRSLNLLIQAVVKMSLLKAKFFLKSIPYGELIFSAFFISSLSVRPSPAAAYISQRTVGSLLCFVNSTSVFRLIIFAFLFGQDFPGS